MSRWRKKQVVIEAWQFMPAGRREELPPWIDPRWFYEDVVPDGDRTVERCGTPHMLIPTAAGALRADLTDWIIRGVKGEVYPCKADVFAASYEPVRQGPTKAGGGVVIKTLLLMSVLLVAACAGQPSMTPSERLELYRAHAGDPVSGFQFSGRLWGWRALGDSALAVWTRSNQGYFVELAGRCQDLPFAHSIGLTSSAGRVSAGFDRVIVQLPSGRTPNRVGCRIRTIRPINTQVVKEQKADLGEGEVTERDPSIPDEPTQ